MLMLTVVECAIAMNLGVIFWDFILRCFCLLSAIVLTCGVVYLGTAVKCCFSFWLDYKLSSSC